ncbi:Stress responsive A/B Barrel Domain [Rubrobacter radiotolerans]|uniref:Dabb family protein n=1 Tax=Rubrobacter radiotolerans TaxID=42256 RepID=A0A023X1N1_RUBRA|nr:Dabb family protein [Rubrobacter radiotolerans]AHY46248.1 Stress responsive A/B Barrel Domain [Rubrobacter radiotolerans]MDX5893656.1 Dabb family protein [Rubrobacter radiotolerans]SMC04216.1 Stress responsive A/B Barrel Domain [Rubrobacter radiotolerans DSM 5868]
MVDHLVFFALKDDVSEADERDLLESLRALREEVPNVRDLTAGRDFSGRSGEYTHALFVRFDDAEALKSYATHPAHLAVVEKLEQLTTGRIVCDYEH